MGTKLRISEDNTKQKCVFFVFIVEREIATTPINPFHPFNPWFFERFL